MRTHSPAAGITALAVAVALLGAPSAPCLAASDAGAPSMQDGVAARDALYEGDDPAALVNGEALPVHVLTDYIDGVRRGIGSQTDAAWEAYLADQGTTPDRYWASLIEHYARQMVVEQRWRELGIEAGEDEVDLRIDQLKGRLGVMGDEDDGIWGDYLAMYGYTEQSLRGETAYYICRDKLFAAEVDRPCVNAETVGRYLGLGDDGALDVASLDKQTRDSLVEQAQDLAWSQACEAYVDGLVESAQVEVIVEHQYDVAGQSHG